jgi:uncharacterized protein (TIGR00730 family)
MPSDRRIIAVFGSSEPEPGSPGWDLARDVGRALGEAGYGVVTGGYGGVMAAASSGASDAGAPVHGVTCRIFTTRRANRWVTDEEQTADLHERTRRLVERADGFVVLPGSAGTLAEMSLLWALHRAGCLGERPVIAVGPEWDGLLRYLGSRGWLEPAETERMLRADTARDVVALIETRVPRPTEDAS